MAAPRKELYNKYADELVKNAKLIAARGKGILAADESTGTIGKRFEAIKVKNVEENRRAYRQLLFTAKGLEKYISGVILFEETLYQKTDDGTTFADLLKQKGIFIGLKVDEGLKEIPYTAAETYTQGFTNLDVRCAKYYAAGSRFAKWRATLTIKGDELPSELAYHETAWSLARYAAICQKFGLVPVVEPETLMDGAHSIQRCAEVTEKVVGLCYTYLAVNRVVLEGTLLKPNMVIAGQDSKVRSTAAEVGYWTSKVLKRTVPAAVPGINFLSGGQSEEEATVNLNAINAAGDHPWTLSFSYGRALQKSVLKAWGGKKENVAKAQAVLLQRAAANSAATWGKYHGEAATADSNASLFVKDYKY